MGTTQRSGKVEYKRKYRRTVAWWSEYNYNNKDVDTTRYLIERDGRIGGTRVG